MKRVTDVAERLWAKDEARCKDSVAECNWMLHPLVDKGCPDFPETRDGWLGLAAWAFEKQGLMPQQVYA